MTPEQVTLIKSSWKKVLPISETAAELFYGKLFELDAELKPLFKGDIKEQGAKLMKILNTVINSLDNDFTDKVKEAWTTAYVILATTKKNTAKVAA